jgi:hypothetical protein
MKRCTLVCLPPGGSKWQIAENPPKWGDFLREAAALIIVLRPLEDGVKNERISGTRDEL